MQRQTGSVVCSGTGQVHREMREPDLNASVLEKSEEMWGNVK